MPGSRRLKFWPRTRRWLPSLISRPIDQKEALASAQLIRKEIEQHCAKLGLDADMDGLTGGQRVKFVLVACSWQLLMLEVQPYLPAAH